MSLLFDRVSFNYPGTRQGLNEVSFGMRTGELVAVIGPSGSGKSTLLKLVSGLTTGHTGSIALDGHNLDRLPVHQRNIGMVFQSYSLFPHLNVLDNIAYGLKLRKIPLAERHAKARNLLEAIGMGEFASRDTAQLSGGQQQRVALARALAIDPKALLLDEPLSALDAGIRGQLRDQIRSLQKRFNATTLLVTHDQEEALTMADRVAVLKEGRLLQLATPKDIYEQPVNCDVARFVGLSSIFKGVVASADRVDLGFTQLCARTGKRLPGQSVFAVIRPEHVEVDPPEGTLNRLVGQVTAQRYLGAFSRFDFALPGTAVALLGESPTLPQTAVSIAPRHICLLDN